MQQQAVIEIGSTGIRMLVVEITEDKKRNILDRSELPANIGRDVFTSGVISRETMISCLQILRRFAEQLKSWGIQPKDTIVLGTSAVRESTNRDPFVDRIKIKTGFTVRVIDGLEENRLMYIAVTECLKGATVDGQDIMQDDSVILEIAGGTTEMMLIENGRMVGAHSIRLGTVIIEQQVRSIKGGIEDARSYIEEFIRNSKSQFNAEMNLDKVKKFIAVGTDMIESHLVFFGVDDLGYGQKHRFLFLMCRHAFKYAIVDTVAVLFEEFDHAAAAFIVGNVVGYDYHVLAGAGTVIFYHLEI